MVRFAEKVSIRKVHTRTFSFYVSDSFFGNRKFLAKIIKILTVVLTCQSVGKVKTTYQKCLFFTQIFTMLKSGCKKFFADRVMVFLWTQYILIDSLVEPMHS